MSLEISQAQLDALIDDMHTVQKHLDDKTSDQALFDWYEICEPDLDLLYKAFSQKQFADFVGAKVQPWTNTEINADPLIKWTRMSDVTEMFDFVSPGLTHWLYANGGQYLVVDEWHHTTALRTFCLIVRRVRDWYNQSARTRIERLDLR